MKSSAWVISGSRTINDRDMIYKELDKTLKIYGTPEYITHGGCHGVDIIAGDWAKEKGITVYVKRPNWKDLGKKAGVIRNQEMIDSLSRQTGLFVAFWDGSSKGTHHAIKHTRKRGIQERIIEVDNKEDEE